MNDLSWWKRAGAVFVLSVAAVIAPRAQTFTFSPHHVARAVRVSAPQQGALRMAGLGFAPVVDYDSGGEYAYSVAVADVNGDGRPDLMVTNSCTGIPDCHGTVGVLLGNGDGTFQTAVTYRSGGFWAYAIAVADVNADGKPDLLVGNMCPDTGNCNGSVVGVLLGHGDGTFQAAMSYGSGGYVPQCCGSYSLAVADVNGDGKLDVLVANPCEGVNCSNGTNGTVGVLLGNGDGTFQTAVTYGSGGFYAMSAAVADVNADGKPDLLVANVCASSSVCRVGTIGVLLGNGDGTFQAAVRYDSGGGDADSVAVADVNGDGKPDLLVANVCATTGPCEGENGGSLSVLLGNGDGTFQTPVSFGSGGYAATSITVVDVDGDGKPDLVVADVCASSEGDCDGIVGVLLGNGDGTFQTAVTYSSGASGADWVAAADVNGDGRPDLIVANQCAITNCTGSSEGSVDVLINVSSPPSFTTLVDFVGSGVPEYMSLIQGEDADLYGTAGYGGSFGGGTVFKTSQAGMLNQLYNFCYQDGCTDGAFPVAGLAHAIDGNFYGTTDFGGIPASGTVFKITPAGTLTTLYAFCSPYPCTDGAYPYGPLIQATDGSFYGTTYGGGTSTNCSGFGCGTVFKITPNGALTTLHSFTFADGASPYAGLIEAVGGDFYGTTYGGGAYGQGSVFKITRTGTLTTVYSFCALPNCVDGQGPTAGLTQALDGNFYGTTVWGGASGDGTVFKVTPRGKLSTLHSFNGADSSGPTAGLVQATDGNLYGTTFAAYAGNGYGTVFKITATGILTTLYRFCSQPSCTDGAYPVGGLVQATNGILYGTTTTYGDPDCFFGSGCGTVFSLDMGLGPFVTFVRAAGRVGQTGPILGQGFIGTTSVTLNGIPASFTVISDTYIRATVPEGATTGYVTVTTPSGTLTSNVPFHVIK